MHRGKLLSTHGNRGKEVITWHAKTPKRNIAETEFSPEFAGGEDPMKGANRNSKQGRKGRMNDER